MSSLSFEELMRKECERFWPTSKIDTVVDLPNGGHDDKALAYVAETLMASSLYVELERAPQFYDNSPVVVELIVKCRLPSSTAALADFLGKLYSRKARLFYRVDKNAITSSVLACPYNVWAEMKRSGKFSLSLPVQIDSERAVVDIQLDGESGQGQSISNCPCKISDLVGTSTGITEPQAQKTKATLELLETELASFQI